MAEPPFSHKSAEGQKSGEGSVAYLEQALWRKLTDFSSEEEFCQSWLALQSRIIGGVRMGLVVLGPPEKGPFVPITIWPPGGVEYANLIAISERSLQERKGIVTRQDSGEGDGAGESDLIDLAFPVRSRGSLYGVVALQIEARSHDDLQPVMRQLQWGVSWLENWLLRQEVDKNNQHLNRLTTVLDLTAAVLEEEKFQNAASAFVTLFANKLSCQRVSLGLLERKHIKVESLSHSAHFSKDLNLIRTIQAAMEECLDQQQILVFPEPDQTFILKAHAALAAQTKEGAICSIPFLDNEGKGYGVLTLERTAEMPFDTDTVDLCDSAAALIIPILEEKRKNDRIILKKILEAVQNLVNQLVGPKHVAWKLAAAAGVLVVLFFALATGEHRVTANVTLEGTVQRALPAPEKGFIFEAPVRAGDIVSERQVMCRLDDRDLRLEKLKWHTQKQQAVLRFREAMADSDAAKMNQFKEQMNQAEAQLSLIEEQLNRINIVAPFAGVVVKGDLSQSLGAPVERGQVLFEVAPLDSYRVKLQVDDSDINYVKVGQKGNMVLTALPDLDFPFSVEKITPVTTAKEGQNLFLLEAHLEQTSERLRPGMEGFGKIDTGRQKLFWIWTHSLFDWVRLKLWSLWP